MKKLMLAMCTIILALGLTLGEAEAARLGGGKSLGMQRQSVAPRPSTPAQQATPAAPTAPVGTPAAAPKRNWMGPLAGLAAGLGIAALFSHFGMGAGMSNFLMIALLAMAAVFVFKWLFARKASGAPSASPLQYAGGSNLPPQPHQPVAAPQFGAAAAPATPAAARVPEGFDSEGFLRIAKVNFVRLQAANDAKNMDDIRQFVAPEMFAEFQMEMNERGNAAQQTDVVTLNAELLEVVTEGNRHVASVHFSGMIREVVGAAAVPFNEVWNLSKPVSGDKGWVIAGIQQLS
jgi:predicted lipid-binding transport protein (Tim44 family)